MSHQIFQATLIGGIIAQRDEIFTEKQNLLQVSRVRGLLSTLTHLRAPEALCHKQCGMLEWTLAPPCSGASVLTEAEAMGIAFSSVYTQAELIQSCAYQINETSMQIHPCTATKTLRQTYE